MLLYGVADPRERVKRHEFAKPFHDIRKRRNCAFKSFSCLPCRARRGEGQFLGFRFAAPQATPVRAIGA
jgi:hypothetical protein